MFRQLSLAAVAAIALGTAAFAPSSASAWWDGYHHRWHPGWWGGPHYYGVYTGGGYGCRRWVPTPWGPRLRWVC